MNMKLILLTLAIILMASVVLAEEKTEEAKPVSGKDLYKNHCKQCHMEDSDAGEYTPMTLIQEQWEEFFDDYWTETHGEVSCPKDKTKMVTDMWDADMLKAVKKFCVDHAADSEQPMTCG
ncbi:MAG: c-type cytochrome [bacterium]|nr:c-type cytochrome [bacterium]